MMQEKKIQQWAIMIRRTFQALFEDMEHHYNESKQLYDKIRLQDVKSPEKFDQKLWEQEKASSRACFISAVAGLEALCNALLSDFQIHSVDDIPKEWTNRKQRKINIRKWRLIWKIQFIPTLCNKKLIDPDEYFNIESQDFRMLDELINIRNSIMHGRVQKPKILITFRPDHRHIINDDFPENFWPISKIPIDFTSYNYECAKIARDNIIWAKGELVRFIADILPEDYLGSFTIELVGDKFESNEG